MTDADIKKTSRRVVRKQGVPRCVALLGGTTTLADCMVAIRYLTDPRRLVQGRAITEYEQAFAQAIGVRYAYSFSSGRVGLYGLLRTLGVGNGDEVLLQVPTHIVVPNAIRYTGAQPVYVDCCLNTYNMDLEQAECRITPRTKVLVLQHTFGIPADIDTALSLARRYRLEIIEDCVHSLGATYNGRQVGSFGRAAFFSTEETKTISSVMGGMVVTDDPELAARVKTFQASCAWPQASLTARYILKFVLYHLLTEPHLHRYTRALYERLGRPQPIPGATSDEEQRGVRPVHYEQRLSNAQAALALRQLRRLKLNIVHRREVASAYQAQLSMWGFDLPQAPTKAEPAFVRYPIWMEDRATALHMAAPHAVLGNWFTSVLEEATDLVHGGYETGSCPRAEAAAKHLINLPTHPRVRPQDIEAIVSVLVRAARITKEV